jgi:hypothetical protein
MRKRTLLTILALSYRFTLTLLLLLSLVNGAAQASSSSGGGGGSCPTCNYINVTSTVFDTDTSGAPLLFRSDDYYGIGQAIYTNVNNVESFIDSSGVWYLNLYAQKTGTRTLYITPDDAVGSEPTAPPPNWYWRNVEITSKCMDSFGNTVPFPNLTNGSSNCTFGVDFNYNGIVYKLLIGRVLNATDPSPGTAILACDAVNSSRQCVAWTITAGTGTSPVVANLYSDTGGPRSAPWVFIGQYYNSVRVNVNNP